jgi:hypothetical protein
MPTTLADLAADLQTLFTTDATDAARSTGFVRHARKLTGPAFAQVTVFGWLHDPTASLVDTWVRIGTRWRVRLRLLAWRLAPEVAAKRRERLVKRAQKSGRPTSVAQATLADWNVLVTNVPPERLSLREACVLARLRWQVELLFKLWKSGGRLDESAAVKPYRVLCELLAKLLGLVVQHWTLLRAGPPLGQSQPRAAKRMRADAERLASALGDVAALLAVLVALQKRLWQLSGKQRRRGQPAAFQLAENPYDLEYNYMPVA